jgi:hypothetical protein
VGTGTTSSPQFTSPNAQTTAGYTYWMQPTEDTSQIEETWDMGEQIDSSKVIIDLDHTVLSGFTDDAVTINTYVKANLTTTWSTAQTGVATFWNNPFRHIKVTVDYDSLTTGSGLVFYDLNEITATLRSKVRRDSGSEILTSGSQPETVVFNTTDFVDIRALVATANSTAGAPIYPVVDFVDVPNPTSFGLYLFNSTGGHTAGTVFWNAEGF